MTTRRRWSTAEVYLKPNTRATSPRYPRRYSSSPRMAATSIASSSQAIEIDVAIRDLSHRHINGLSHIVAVLYDNDTEMESRWKQIGTIKTVAPRKRTIHFEEKFRYSYIFEKTQLIKIDLCRVPEDGEASCSDEVIGSCIFKVDELIGSFGLQLRRPLCEYPTIASTLSACRPSHNFGCVHLTGQIPEKEQPIVAQFHGKGLDRKDFLWDETAVFFRVYRLEEGSHEDQLVLLYESEAIKNHSHPQWSEFRIEAQDAADNRNRLLEIWVMYRDVDSREGYIGKFLTTYAKMKYGPGPDNVYNIINEMKQQQKKSYEHSGRMELVKFTDVSFCSFLDYIASGTQLHYELAVDFSSGSGISSREFDSEFQLAMRAIGGILRDYTPNRLFRAYGLGAKIPPTFHESHEFHLNFQLDPTCRGLDGVMEAYKKAQTMITPMKEAKFAPVVHAATRLSLRSGFRGLHYHVLVMFTPSPPSDIKDLQSALVAASEAPLSIMFVALGDDDFSPLQKLVNKRKDMKRDCVEIVILSDVVLDTDPISTTKSRIAEKALHPVPQQMVNYMHLNNIAAKPPIQVCRSPLFHSSSLIPDKPTEFTFDESPEISPTFERPLTDRRGSDSHYLDVDLARNCLTVRVPERCHSVLQTSREQYQRRLKERGLGKMRFPRMELSTLESSGSANDSIS